VTVNEGEEVCQNWLAYAHILNSNYCPGWRDFKFIISFNALATIRCNEASSM